MNQSGPSLNHEAVDLLISVDRTLEDLAITYAAEHHNKSDVEAAWKRLIDDGGTICVIGRLQDRIYQLLKASGGLEK